MKEITIEGNEILDKNMLHTCLKEQLQVPEYYGNNLDALHDVLEGINEEVVFTINDFSKLQEYLGNYTKSLLQVLADVGCEVKSMA